MELTGDVLIGAPRAKVWAGLNDPQVLTRCIPGCEGMEATGPTERTARVAVKVGPVRAKFSGRIRMEDVRPDLGCVLHFEGSGGPAGMAKGHSSVELSDEGGGTRLRYTTQASVGGKLGQVGGRMIDAAAKQMADQFFAALNTQMTAAPPEQAAPTPPQDDASTATAQAPAAATTPLPASAAPAPQPAAALPATGAVPAAGESVRILWFALGALSTGFGVWIASLLK